MNRLVVLIIAFFCFSGVAYWLLQAQQQSRTEVLTQGALLPQLSAQSGNINKLVISDASGDIFVAEKMAGAWQARHLDTQYMFPADEKEIASLINALSAARILELKTQNESSYPRLGVEDITLPDATSRLVSLSTDTATFTVLIGKIATSGQGNYARLPSGKESYLLDKTLSLPQSAFEWLSTNVLGLEAVDIVELHWSNTAGERLSIKKNDDAEWLLEALPDNRELRYPNILSQTVRDLVTFRFDEVEAFNQNKVDSVVVQSTVEFVTSTGEKVQARLSEADDEGQQKLYFTHSSRQSWYSDWVFVLDSFSAKPFQVTLETLTDNIVEASEN